MSDQTEPQNNLPLVLTGSDLTGTDLSGNHLGAGGPSASTDQNIESSQNSVIRGNGSSATQEEWDAMVPEANRLFQSARKSHYAHLDDAQGLSRRHRQFSLWASLLAGLSGVTVLGKIADLPAVASYKVGIEILQGLTAVAAATLSAFQTQQDYSKMAEAHRQAGSEYGEIRRNLRIMFRLPLRMRDDLRLYFDSLQAKLDKLAEISPPISHLSWSTTDDRLKRDPSHLMDNNAE